MRDLHLLPDSALNDSLPMYLFYSERAYTTHYSKRPKIQIL